MSFQLVVVEKGALPADVRRQYPEIMKRLYLELAEHWHQVYRPLHFSKAAYFRYGYKKRSRKTRQSKGHDIPLVNTGESRRMASIPDYRGTSKGARVVMRVPALNFKGDWIPKREADGATVLRWVGPRMNMREELQRTNRQEVQSLKLLAGRTLTGLIKSVRSRRVMKLS
jgi:hypothetical protein